MVVCHTDVMNMKQALATLPPARPMLLLYTSILVAPVARIAVTCNISMVSYIITNFGVGFNQAGRRGTRRRKGEHSKKFITKKGTNRTSMMMGLLTRIMRARAAMLAPRITKASWVGSTLGSRISWHKISCWHQ